MQRARETEGHRRVAPRLHAPRAGPLGWGVLVAAFVLALLLAFALAGSATGTARVKEISRRAHAPRARTAVSAGVPIDPRTFAPGACVSFAPTRGDNRHTVFLDAGHGGLDAGGEGVTETGTTIYEDGENLAIALEVSGLLREKGFKVVLSRVTSTQVVRLTPADMTGPVLSSKGAVDDVAARDLCADDAKATVLLGVYMDAGTSPADAGCLTAWDPSRPFAAKSHLLASLVQGDVLRSMNGHGWQIPDDGVDSDATLGGEPLTTVAVSYDHLLLLGPAVPGWFTTPSEMPGALIEPLFVSDPFEASIAQSAAGHHAVARGIVQAIEQYFDR